MAWRTHPIAGLIKADDCQQSVRSEIALLAHWQAAGSTRLLGMHGLFERFVPAHWGFRVAYYLHTEKHQFLLLVHEVFCAKRLPPVDCGLLAVCASMLQLAAPWLLFMLGFSFCLSACCSTHA